MMIDGKDWKLVPVDATATDDDGDEGMLNAGAAAYVDFENTNRPRLKVADDCRSRGLSVMETLTEQERIGWPRHMGAMCDDIYRAMLAAATSPDIGALVESVAKVAAQARSDWLLQPWWATPDHDGSQHISRAVLWHLFGDEP